MSLTILLLVGTGGAVGAACRNFLITLIENHHKHWLTTGAFFVNCTSCFIAGACLALSLDAMPHAIVMTGFCGGFSTLSFVNLEAVGYLLEGNTQGRLRCFAYLAATYAAALATATLGFIAF